MSTGAICMIVFALLWYAGACIDDRGRKRLKKNRR